MHPSWAVECRAVPQEMTGCGILDVDTRVETEVEIGRKIVAVASFTGMGCVVEIVTQQLLCGGVLSPLDRESGERLFVYHQGF